MLCSVLGSVPTAPSVCIWGLDYRFYLCSLGTKGSVSVVSMLLVLSWWFLFHFGLMGLGTGTMFEGLYLFRGLAVRSTPAETDRSPFSQFLRMMLVPFLLVVPTSFKGPWGKLAGGKDCYASFLILDLFVFG